MTAETLFEAVTNIEDRFIEEADPARCGKKTKITPLRRYLPVAAAFVFVIGISAFALRSGLFAKKGASMEVAPAAESARMTMAATESPAEVESEEESCEITDEESRQDSFLSENQELGAAPPEPKKEMSGSATSSESSPLSEPIQEMQGESKPTPVYHEGVAYLPAESPEEETAPNALPDAEISFSEDPASCEGFASADRALEGCAVIWDGEEDGFFVETDGFFIRYERVSETE